MAGGEAMRERGRGISHQNWSRRDFTRAVVGASSTAALGWSKGANSAESRVDSLLEQFCRTLSVDQRRAIHFPSDEPRRTSMQNHWAIVPVSIASFTADQQELALGLIRQICTPQGFAALTRARVDDSGGWKHDHLAVFGAADEPGRFEWVLTGRHLTLRGSSSGVITGGPLFFGHAAPPEANIWRCQAEGAGALFRSLDVRQQARALVPVGQGGNSDLGLSLLDLGTDQRANVRRLLATLAEPFRAFEVSSIQACLRIEDEFAGMRWQAFRSETDRSGEPPKVWRLIGSGFAWSFHGEPHIHSWFDSV